MILPGGGRGGLKGLAAQLGRGGILALGHQLIGLHQQAHPFRRLAENQGRALAGKHLAPQQFAGDDRPEDLGQQHGLGIEAGDDLQLGQRLVQPAQHTVELEQKDRAAAESAGLSRISL